jgi:site-specific recombinase XerD
MAVEMSPQTKTTKEWTLASVALLDAYTDFVLSRQVMNCTPATMEFYKYGTGRFMTWVEQQGVTSPEQITARHVRQYLATLAERGLADTSLHGAARSIRTLMRFWHSEGYLPALIKFEMPKLAKKRLPVLTAEQLQRVIKVCNVRDKALVLFMADSGLRRTETINLNWDDVDMQTGLIRVKQGKGRKDRASVIGVTTRRALLRYRRTLDKHSENDAIFQTRTGDRFTGTGFLVVFRRLSKRSGIHITPHALRRTFAILSLRAGMSPLHLQGLGGWSGLEMVYHYAQMVDDDLLQAHLEHSPVDNLDRLK